MMICVTRHTLQDTFRIANEGCFVAFSPSVQGQEVILLVAVIHVRFEVFTVVTMKNVVVWDVSPCGSCMKQHFGGLYRIHLQGENNQ
jgi:hypothetical protein